jgi:pSer/pThr/pTyr-binding forkhead associated (FHA) protein
VQPERVVPDEEAPAPSVESGATMVYKPPAPPPTEAASPVELGVEREVVALVEDGRRHEIRKRRTVIGRSKDCDIQLADPNISRRHAELRQEGTAYWIVDLDSTNGIEINGHRVKRAKLDEGDTVTLGSSDLVFERSTE